MPLNRLFPALLRIGLGWIFLWAFLDKVFGWGFATEAGKSWLDGVSPTAGFLLHGTNGPFSSFFMSLAGQGWVDWLFMLGLLGIGTALILGIFNRIAGTMGALLVVLMFLAASMPPLHNPLIDEHIIYALLGLWIALEPARFNAISFARKWSKMPMVMKRSKWLT